MLPLRRTFGRTLRTLTHGPLRSCYKDWQQSLPRLPLPKLEDTLSRFKERAAPLLIGQKDEELKLKEMERVTTALASDPQMAELQSKLEAYDASVETADSNYIAQFWYDAYFEDQSPTPIHHTPGFLFRELCPERVDQASTAFPGLSQKACALVMGLTSQIADLMNSRIPPLQKPPICLAGVEYVWGGCRLAQRGTDTYTTTSGSRHVAVLKAGRIFRVDVLDAAMEQLPAKDILGQLSAIAQTVDFVDSQSAALCDSQLVCMGTASHREDWGPIREDLIANGTGNEKAFETVETALFAFCIDSDEHAAADALSGTQSFKRTCHGGVHLGEDIGFTMNRYWDKSIQISAIGQPSHMRMAFAFEHSVLDAMPVVFCLTDGFERANAMLREDPQFAMQTPAAAAPNTEDINEVLFDIDAKSRTALQKCLEIYERRALKEFSYKNLHFTEFGKGAIKQLKISPDGFVQMAFQLAFHRLYGGSKPSPSTYESCSTALHRAARTETIRPVSHESVKFVREFDSEMDAKAKDSLIREGVAAHANFAKLCQMGQGFDRHIYALQQLAKTTGSVPPAFENFLASAASQTVEHLELSTSCVNDPCLVNFSFGPVVAGGWGIAYAVEKDWINASVGKYLLEDSEDQSTADEYADQIFTALIDMKFALELAQGL